jgi:predicted SAM-dependent methyltransferase
MVWRIDDPQGNEAGKVKYELVRYTRGIGLDMGCGPRKAFPHMIGVDSGKDTELFGIAMKPDVVCDAADPASVRHNFGAASVPYVFSSHMLEHVEDYEATLQAWWELIYTGGYLILYLPHADLYPRMGERWREPRPQARLRARGHHRGHEPRSSRPIAPAST